MIKENPTYVKQSEEPIATNKSSEIWLCEDTRNHTFVALKKIKDSISFLKEKYPKRLELMESEVRVLKKLAPLNNPNIVRLIEYFIQDDHYHLVFEYCESGNLEELLQRKKVCTEQETVYFLKQLLSGFQCLHENHVIHRDIRLENILIKEGVLKICDFGLCRENEGDTSLGNVYYMAPEILKGARYNSKVDIYSLGVVVYRLLFGDYPYKPSAAVQVQILKEIEKENLNLEYGNVKISDEMKNLIKGMLKFESKKRISWAALYKHEALISKQDLTKSAIRILTMNEIVEEKQAALFEKLKTSQIEFYSNFEIVEEKEEYLNEDEKMNFVFIEKPMEFPVRADQIQSQQSNSYKRKFEKIQALERAFLYRRNLIAFLVRVLDKGIKMKENWKATFTFFLIIKKIKFLSSKLLEELSRKDRLEEEKEIWEEFLASNSCRNLKEVIEELCIIYEIYWSQFRKDAQELFNNYYSNDPNFKAIGQQLQSDAFPSEKVLDQVLEIAVKDYLQMYLKHGNSYPIPKEKSCYFNEILDCVKLNEIFKFQQEKEEGMDFEGYEKKYWEMEPKDLVELARIKLGKISPLN